MSVSRIFSACLVVCLVATMSSVVMANLIVNGDFESVTGSTFDNWVTTIGSTYTVATSPMNIGGTNSARLINGGTAGAGMLKQRFDVAGLSDFQIDFDFAFLDCGDIVNREFSVMTYAANGTSIVDSVGVYRMNDIAHDIKCYNSSTLTWIYQHGPWQRAYYTEPDINTAKVFDGETPEVNHLTLLGRGYGTDNYSLTITVNDVPWTVPDHLTNNLPIGTIAFYGKGAVVDGLVDNVEVNDATAFNGDFESVVAGKYFVGWQTTMPGTTYNVATTPMNIDGTNSCQILHGTTDGSMLKRQFDSEGLSDFRVELDLASLVSVNTTDTDRVFSLMTQDSAGNIMDNINLIGSEGQVQILTADGVWEKTGAFIDPTIDTGVEDSFDGETPVVNHLMLEATGYGTEDYSMTITLTGDYTYTYTYTGHLGDVGNVHNAAPTTIALYGAGCVSDFIVDNITVEAILTPGDADGDRDVDGDDAAALAANWLTSSGATWAMGDFNGDYKVNDLDAALLATNWTGALGTSVPEPSSFVLLLIGAVLCLARRNNRFPGRRLFRVAVLALCLLGLNQACFAEDYGFDYPLIFAGGVRPDGEGGAYAPLTTWPYGFHAVHEDITPTSYAGAWRNAYDWRHRGSMTACYNQNRPVAITLIGNNAPYDGTVDPDALTKVMDYLSYKGMRLDYVFMDHEPETAQENIELAVQQVRAHSDPNINQAKLGNFRWFPGLSPEMDILYANSGLDIAMPDIYQWGDYQYYISNNERASLFDRPLENFSKAARNLPTGHQLIPWVGNYVEKEGYDPDPLPHEDTERLMQHVRLRGADGYYMWRSSQLDWYDPAYPTDTYGTEAFTTAMINAWQELDWLFDGVDKDDIEVLNLATNRAEGFEWSAVQTANGVALLTSNLDTIAHTITAAEMLAAGMDSPYVVELFGSTSGQITLAAGTHSLDTYSVSAVSVPEPSSLLMLASMIFMFAGWARVNRK